MTSPETFASLVRAARTLACQPKTAAEALTTAQNAAKIANTLTQSYYAESLVGEITGKLGTQSAPQYGALAKATYRHAQIASLDDDSTLSMIDQG